MDDIFQAISIAEQKLKNSNIKSYKLDVRLIFCFSFQISQEVFFLKRDQIKLSSEKLEAFYNNIKKRENRQPVSQIIGQKPFFDNIFAVNGQVLTPRPDSEIIIETVLSEYFDKSKKLRFLEIGVGSGCLILTILNFFKNSSAIAVDISNEAIKISQQNANNLQLDKQIKIIKSDLFTQVPNSEKFDIIISNPPYIPSKEILNLEDEVKKFEPTIALDGGEDGLDFYRNIAKQARKFLKKDGKIILEIGQGQQGDVIEIFHQESFTIEQQNKDLSGTVRCLVFQ